MKLGKSAKFLAMQAASASIYRAIHLRSYYLYNNNHDGHNFLYEPFGPKSERQAHVRIGSLPVVPITVRIHIVSVPVVESPGRAKPPVTTYKL